MTVMRKALQISLSLGLMLCLLTSPAVFAKLFKTTDANGNVSFSDTPTEASAGSTQETMKMPKPANTLQSNKSQQQQEQDFMQETDNRNASLREQWAQYDEALKTAKSEVKGAKENLKNAETPTEGDRVFTKTATGGFSRETPQRKSRISDAEQALADAKKSLSKAKKLRPEYPRPAKESLPSELQ